MFEGVGEGQRDAGGRDPADGGVQGLEALVGDDGEARRVKTGDEISLLAQACSMVDAAYTELSEFLRPGVRENECVGLVSKVLYALGSEYVEGATRSPANAARRTRTSTPTG